MDDRPYWLGLGVKSLTKVLPAFPDGLAMSCRQCHEPLREKHFFSFAEGYLICDSCETSTKGRLPEPVSRDGRKTIAGTEDFYARLAADTKRNEASLKLRILIWGPSPESNTPASRKRVELKTALLDAGHDARFSEDFQVENQETGGLPLRTAELIQLTQWKQLLILIVDSYGSIAELNTFFSHMDWRCLVWFREGTGEGFATQAPVDTLETSGAKIMTFSDKDLKCCVVKKMSEDWVAKQQQKENVRRIQVELLQGVQL